jgi:hypothetical protein
MPKIYNILPPSVEDMNEVLALIIYTGPCKPTKTDLVEWGIATHGMYKSSQVCLVSIENSIGH